MIEKEYSTKNNKGCNVNISFGGIGFSGLLTILFVVLKLTKTINWSWLWILCPLWIGIPVYFIFFLVIPLIFFFKK